MAQLVNCLLRKLGDTSLDPCHPHRSCAQQRVYYPSPVGEGVEIDRFQELTG